MAEYIRRSLILSEDDINAILKINKVFDLYGEMNKLIKSMSEKEFRMLERSLEFTMEEMKKNG